MSRTECQIPVEGTPPEGCAPCELDPGSVTRKTPCPVEAEECQSSPGGGGGGSSTIRFYVPGTASCFVPVVVLSDPEDKDRDFVYDECERLLAEAMAPELLIDALDQAPTFEPYFAVNWDGFSPTTGRPMVKGILCAGVP